MKFELYYKALGNLLYAVAKADGQVNSKEKLKVKSIVAEQLLQLEDSLDDYGSDAAFATEFQFEECELNDLTSKVAFESFEEYFSTHKKVIKPHLTHFFYNLAKHVAQSSAGINKSESNILAKIEALIK